MRDYLSNRMTTKWIKFYKYNLMIIGLLLATGIMSCKDKTDRSSEDKEGTVTLKTTETYNASKGIKLSLAQWSFHKALQSGEMDHLEFAEKAGALGFDGVEYVNYFFMDKAEDQEYLNQMYKNANIAGVKNLLIMVDGEGDLGVQDKDARSKAVQNHIKWIEAAKILGCHSIRVNAFGEGSDEEQTDAMVNALTQLGKEGAQRGINILVENHGGLSSDGNWLSDVMKKVGMENVGTLPDFGNFCIEREGGERWGTPCIKEFDKYQGMKLLLPFAKAVSAKSYDFDESGLETTIDFPRMLEIIREYEYSGYIGVEYEGERLSEEEGIIATRDLLRKIFK